MRVVLDSNFLMIPGQFGVDVFAEMERILDVKYTLVTPESVVAELRQLSKRRSKNARAARLALQLVERKDVRVLPHHEKRADVAICEMALEEGTVVATQDRVLQNKLRKQGVPLLTLKARKYIAVEGFMRQL